MDQAKVNAFSWSPYQNRIKNLSNAAKRDADRAKSRFPKLLKIEGTGWKHRSRKNHGRMLHTQEVTGSSPVAPTIQIIRYSEFPGIAGGVLRDDVCKRITLGLRSRLRVKFSSGQRPTRSSVVRFSIAVCLSGCKSRVARSSVRAVNLSTNMKLDCWANYSRRYCRSAGLPNSMPKPVFSRRRPAPPLSGARKPRHIACFGEVLWSRPINSWPSAVGLTWPP